MPPGSPRACPSAEGPDPEFDPHGSAGFQRVGQGGQGHIGQGGFVARCDAGQRCAVASIYRVGWQAGKVVDVPEERTGSRDAPPGSGLAVQADRHGLSPHKS